MEFEAQVAKAYIHKAALNNLKSSTLFGHKQNAFSRCDGVGYDVSDCL
jgi:hypothetical protein